MIYSNRYKQKSKAKFGDLSELINEDLISICLESKHIAVVGPNGSGKVSLTNMISSKIGYNYMLSDDFIEGLSPEVHSYSKKSQYHIQPYNRSNPVDSMYSMLESVRNNKSNIIYAGSNVPRLLRAGLRDYGYVPDTVIVIECNTMTLEYGHIRRGQVNKLNSNLNAYKGQQTILNEWNSMLNADMLIDYPTIVKIDTSVM